MLAGFPFGGSVKLAKLAKTLVGGEKDGKFYFIQLPLKQL
jgi:hypothetical protein